ncbi:restriction endonuclease subunit S [Schwartzia succinivorans]|jgi:type I restriction enzyme S subunit|uniref:Type I restriction enzyme, S subunit n=1 Tax=Schwartzia succinivorans DSM 10502 TaxID=1123243 RepID=A0A1M4Z0C1_9FIRM|nr:restriction endonuclease subunit S [Schwartzia succinivorans]SHF11430.1 type I restriction enzyme, S subunit [Schwartzia succinivorans DSM 10502]
MSWEKVKLEDVCLSISDGDHQAPPKVDNGIPFVTISNINSTNKFDLSEVMYVPQEYYDHLDSKRKPQKEDILYSVVGSFGIPVYIDCDEKFVFQRHIAILRPDSKKIVSKFLYYVMLGREFYLQADAVAVGAAQRTVSLTALRDMTVNVPSMETQKKIADILSAYDKLIENNQKQIKLLEEAVQRLYKEWFVDLRFPGHEDVKIIDGVPEGWERVCLSNFIEYEIGGGWGDDIPNRENPNQAYVIRGTDMLGITHGEINSLPLRYHGETNLMKRELQAGDIIFEVSGGSKNEGVAKCTLITSQLLNYLHKPVMCASFCKLIRPIRNHSNYLHDCLKYLRASGRTSEYDKRSASSIVNYRWKDFLTQEKILFIPNDILERYNDMSSKIHSKIMTHSLQIELLKQARDRLLPKLISGEIQV